MTKGYDYRKYPILYVDDEEQSLKYFRKAFEKDFEVLVASNAPEALSILDEMGDRIGIVVTDQRMPEQTGIELLERARHSWPGIVRVLTTAYTDLEEAIEAVNSGSIFKYVVKPWNIREFRGSLLRSMEFFLIQRERDQLLKEKLSVLQRMIVADRMKSLGVLAVGLAHHIRHSMVALKTFLDCAPEMLKEEIPTIEPKSPEFWTDLWGLAKQGGEYILEIVDNVIQATVESRQDFSMEIPLTDLIQQAIEDLPQSIRDISKSVSVEIRQDLPPLKVDPVLGRRMFRLLITSLYEAIPREAALAIHGKTHLSVSGTPGICIEIRTDEDAWSDQQVAAMFTAFSGLENKPSSIGLNLLSAFFIIHHHGGGIMVHQLPPQGPGFELHLPLNPLAVDRPSLERDYLVDLFSRYQEPF